MWNLYSCVNSLLISIIRNNRTFVTFQKIDQWSFWLLFLQTRCNVWSSVKLNLMEEKVMGNMIRISGFIFAILIDFVRKRGQCIFQPLNPTVKSEIFFFCFCQTKQQKSGWEVFYFFFSYSFVGLKNIESFSLHHVTFSLVKCV